MCIIAIYIVLFCYVNSELRNNEYREKRIFINCSFLAVLLAIIYRIYMTSLGFEYGMANSDMRIFFALAEEIASKSIIDGFKYVSSYWRFKAVNPISLMGYRLYIYFLSITVFKWNFFSIEMSVLLISIFQVLLSMYSGMVIYNVLKDRVFIYRKISLLLLLLAPSVWVGSVRLLRECFMFLCIALLIKISISDEKNKIIKLAIVFLILSLFRIYYSIVLVPFILLLNEQKKLSRIASITIFVTLFIICVVTSTSFLEVIGVFLSPNFFNQAGNLFVSESEGVLRTGYIPLVDYIGSLWNLFMLVMVAIAVFFGKKDMIVFNSVTMIINMCMIYAIQYSGITELRHKLFFVVPYMILFNKGVNCINQRKYKEVIYAIMIFSPILYTLISMLDFRGFFI